MADSDPFPTLSSAGESDAEERKTSLLFLFLIFMPFFFSIRPEALFLGMACQSSDMLLQLLSHNTTDRFFSIDLLVVFPHNSVLSAPFGKVHLSGPLSNLLCSWLEL